MAAWSYFHTRVMPRVIGCPVPVADTELRNAAAEFLARTRAWREWLEPVTVASDGAKEFDLDVPQGSMVVRLESVTINGTARAIDGSFDLASDPVLHQQMTDGFSSTDRQVALSSRSLPAGSVIQFRVSLAPAKDATSIPDHIAKQYEDGIVAGALHRIRTIPNQTFSDDNRGALDLAIFEREVNRVAPLVFRSHTNTMPRSRVKWC